MHSKLKKYFRKMKDRLNRKCYYNTISTLYDISRTRNFTKIAYVTIYTYCRQFEICYATYGKLYRSYQFYGNTILESNNNIILFEDKITPLYRKIIHEKIYNNKKQKKSKTS